MIFITDKLSSRMIINHNWWISSMNDETHQFDEIVHRFRWFFIKNDDNIIKFWWYFIKIFGEFHHSLMEFINLMKFIINDEISSAMNSSSWWISSMNNEIHQSSWWISSYIDEFSSIFWWNFIKFDENSSPFDEFHRSLMKFVLMMDFIIDEFIIWWIIINSDSTNDAHYNEASGVGFQGEGRSLPLGLIPVTPPPAFYLPSTPFTSIFPPIFYLVLPPFCPSSPLFPILPVYPVNISLSSFLPHFPPLKGDKK